MNSPAKSTTVKTGILIFFFALFIRVIYLLHYEGNPLFDYVAPTFDQSNFDMGAQNFAKGDWLARSPNNSYSPLYKYFLGVIYSLFGRNFHIVFFIQFIIGSLSTLLVFLIGNKLFEYRIGLSSAIVYALYGPNLFYEGILLREFMVPFLTLSCIHALICFKDNPSTANAVLSGLSLSLFLQNRPNILPVLLLLYFYLKDFSQPRVSKKIRVLLASLILFSLPLLAQCYLVHHRLVFFDASGPLTLLTGNITDNPGFGFGESPKIRNFKLNNEITLPRVIKEIISEMTHHPLEFLGLYLRKTYFLFNDTEFPSNLNYYLFQRFSPLLRTPWSHFSIFASLGLLGLLMGVREFKKLKILYIFFSGICLSILLVYVTGRFRPPLVPIMMLFSSYFVFYLAGQLKEKNFLSFTLGSIPVIFLFVCLNQKVAPTPIRGIDFGNLGVAYESRQNYEMALVNYQKFMEADPFESEGYFFTAALYHKLQMQEKAIDVLKLGITNAKSKVKLQSKLADLHFEAGNYQDAEKTLRDALAGNPDNKELLNNLVVVLRKLRETKSKQENLNFKIPFSGGH